jgi:hypothetical protein
MKFEHEGPQHIHPWDLEQGGLSLYPKPLPEIVPDTTELNSLPDKKVQTNVPKGAVHNGFVNPEHFIPRIILQPQRQNGSRRGKRSNIG